MTIAVIGAGASGMAAALQAAWHGASVVLFERNRASGKKLQVTGSGRCNITNREASAEKYSCADSGWMGHLLSAFGVDDLLAMLVEISIPASATADGWYYPLSESARTVVDAFASALQLAGVDIRFAHQVQDFFPDGNGWSVVTASPQGLQEGQYTRVVVAAGGKSFPSLGSRGELFPVLSRLGHTVLPKRPALAPVLADMKEYKALQGIRLDAGAVLLEGTTELARTRGNLIFTEWGLNGPAVMDLSHHISARPGEALTLRLNLLEFHQPAYDSLLSRKRQNAIPLRVFLGAFFPPRAVDYFIQRLGTPEGAALKDLDDGTLNALTWMLQALPFTVKGVKGFEFCQLSAGGVPVGEVDPITLESRLLPGLHLCGETLDVFGPCGGFNLQFAFSSGSLAG
ncbi:MAG TPA: aminoacetone oxidase family FAD-binding enzyme, partial [Anaerolineaceae bacterium]|nr:aminoacetone oxidase family FAD-binding enzyme [Anaerolineaceae bacterium]